MALDDEICRAADGDIVLCMVCRWKGQNEVILENSIPVCHYLWILSEITMLHKGNKYMNFPSMEKSQGCIEDRDGSEEQCLLYPLGGSDRLMPGYANSLGEKQVFHRQRVEDGFERFCDAEDCSIALSATW